MVVIAVAVIILLIAFFVSPLFFPVSYVWKDAQSEDYLLLETFGPFVSGKKNLLGGSALLSGVQVLGWLFLKRRDYGVQALTSKGLTESQAKKLNGCVAARLRLQIRKPNSRSSVNQLVGHVVLVRPVSDSKTHLVSFVSDPQVAVTYLQTKKDKLPGSVSQGYGSSGGALSLPVTDKR